MSVTSPVTGRVTGIVASGVTRAIGHRTRVAFDADALTYIAAVEAADDEALESSIKVAYNNFVKGCKADGTWDAIKASCIMAGARTLAGCLVPLVGTAPTNVGPFVTGDYNRITGLVGNGSTKFLDSNRTGNADPQNDFHAFAWLPSQTLTSEDEPRQIIGSIGNTWLAYNTLIDGASVYFSRARQGASSAINFVANNVIGPLGVSRSTSSNITVRVNDASSSISFASQTAFTPSFFIFAANNGTSATQFSPVRLAFYSIGESLNLENLDTRVTRLLCEIEFGINTGLAGTGYDLDTLKYVNAGYAAGGTLA